MSEPSISLAVIQGKHVLASVSSIVGQPERVQAVGQARYLLTDPDGGAAPQNVTLKRVGKDLHLSLEDSGAESPSLIIEDFYEHPGEVVGMSADGEVYPYVAVSGDSNDEMALLLDTLSSPHTLGGDALSGFMADLSAANGFPWKETLSALGAAAAVAWLWPDKAGKSTPPPPAPSLEAVHDDHGDEVAYVAPDSLTADSTPTLSGRSVANGQVEIFAAGVSLGMVPVDAAGQWSYTPSTALADGYHLFSVVAIDGAGQRSVASATYGVEIDATAPAQPIIQGLTDDAGSLTGDIAHGARTDDTTPTLSGSAEAGSLLTVYQGSEALGSVRVGADGQWAFTVPVHSEGEQRFSVTATDAAGNISVASEAYVVIIDTTPPLAAIDQVEDHAGTLMGPVVNGGRTDDPAPVLTGSSEAGALVTVYDNGMLVGSVMADDTGHWTFPMPARADGEHLFTVTATDDVGNVGPASVAWSVDIDTSSPVAAITSVEDDAGSSTGLIASGARTDDTTPTLTGTATANALVTVFDDGSVIGSVAADASGLWRFAVPTRADGAHAFTVTATNDVGTTGALSTAWIIEIDASSPIASITSIDDDAGASMGPIASGARTDDTTPTLNGTATANALVMVYDNGSAIGSVAADASGIWSFTAPGRMDGAHSLTVTATNDVGTTGATSTAWTIEIDTSSPVAAITSVEDDAGASMGPVASGARTDDTTPTLNGTATANALVMVYDNGSLIGSVAADAAGIWSFTAPGRMDGAHSLTVTATNDVGTTGAVSAAWTVEIDTSVPVATITLVEDDAGASMGSVASGGRTDDTTPTLSGTATANALVKVYDNGSVIGSVAADASGNWSFPVPTRIDGAHAFTVTATNDVGTTGAVSAAWRVEIDTSLPVAAITLVDDNAGSSMGPITQGGRTDDTTPTLSGTATANALVKVYDTGSVIGSVAADASGKWSFPVPTRTDGAHAFTVTATNDVGTTGALSAAWSVEIDTSLPTATITLVDDNVGTSMGPVANGARTDDTTPTLSGTATANALVKVYDTGSVIGSIAADASGKWSFPVPTRTDGAHAFTVTATNDVGTTGAVSTAWRVEIDTSLPVAVITLVDDDAGTSMGSVASGGRTDDTTPTLSGTATANALVKVYDNGGAIGSVTADASGKWSFPVPTRIDGAHAFTVTATNDVGTTGAVSTAWRVEIDTSLPTATITLVDDNAGTSMGPVAHGARTDDTTPTLSGTATANALVRVFDNGAEIGSVTADASGQWSFPVPTRTDGAHAFTVTATNDVGTTGVVSTVWRVEIDTSLPVAAITLVDDDAGTSMGPINNNGRTDDTTPTLSGTATANALVKVYDNGSMIGSVVADASGYWSFTVPTRADGAHAFTVTATNDVGTTGAVSTAWGVDIDTSLPVATIISVADDAGTITGPVANGAQTDDATPTLSGTSTQNALVKIYDNNLIIGSVQADSRGNWTYQVPTRLDGLHDFTVTATNEVGTTGAATQWVIDIDTQAPVARAELISIGKDSGTRDDFITNDGSAGRLLQGRITTGLAGNEKVQVSFDNGASWSDVNMTSATTWSAIDPLEYSTGWSVQMRVIDVAGNATTSSHAITLDTQAPGAPQAILRHNDIIVVDIKGTGAQVGDVVKVVIGSEHVDHLLTQADLDAGHVSVPIKAGHDIAEPYQAAIIDHANNASEFTLRTPDVLVNDFNHLTPVRGVGSGTTLDLGGFDVVVVSSDIDNGIIAPGQPIAGGVRPTSNVLNLLSGVNQPTVFTLHDDRQASYIKFSYNDLESQLILRFYNLDGDLVHTSSPPRQGDSVTFTYELQLPLGVVFHSMEMVWGSGDSMALDNFVFGFRNDDITSSLVPTDQQLSKGTGLLVGSAEDDIFRLTNVDDLDTVTRIAGNGGKDMLVLEGGAQVLNFTGLAEKFESIEIIDITGTGDNTLNLSVGDVLAQGQVDLFHSSGNAQMMVKGDTGDVVSISDLLPDGSDIGNWQMAGNVTLEGVPYSVYQHTNVNAEILVQQGVMTYLDNN
jgi:predicted subunit of tRNA(5-methylaminomethyl-2-thiouridylate) methyltransferase